MVRTTRTPGLLNRVRHLAFSRRRDKPREEAVADNVAEDDHTEGKKNAMVAVAAAAANSVIL